MSSSACRTASTSEPRATVQREDGTYTQEADWPAPGIGDATLHLSAPSATAPASARAPEPVGAAVQRFVDRGARASTPTTC